MSALLKYFHLSMMFCPSWYRNLADDRGAWRKLECFTQYMQFVSYRRCNYCAWKTTTKPKKHAKSRTVIHVYKKRALIVLDSLQMYDWGAKLKCQLISSVWDSCGEHADVCLIDCRGSCMSATACAGTAWKGKSSGKTLKLHQCVFFPGSPAFKQPIRAKIDYISSIERKNLSAVMYNRLFWLATAPVY